MVLLEAGTPAKPPVLVSDLPELADSVRRRDGDAPGRSRGRWRHSTPRKAEQEAGASSRIKGESPVHPNARTTASGQREGRWGGGQESPSEQVDTRLDLEALLGEQHFFFSLSSAPAVLPSFFLLLPALLQFSLSPSHLRLLMAVGCGKRRRSETESAAAARYDDEDIDAGDEDKGHRCGLRQ